MRESVLVGWVATEDGAEETLSVLSSQQGCGTSESSNAFPYQFLHQRLLIDGDSSALHEEGSLVNGWMSKCLLVREPSVRVGVHMTIDKARRGE